MKNKLSKIFLVLGIIFFSVWVMNIILNKYTMYKLNLEFLTPLPLSVILFSLFGLMMFCYLLTYSKDKVSKILYVLVAGISIFVLGFIALFGSESVEKRVLESETIYIREFRFLFGGDDYFYKRDNFLISHYVATFSNNEDASTSYRYDGNVLTATTSISFHEDKEIVIIDFENS